MAKAIVRINAFLNKRETSEVYTSIYNQLKAGLEVITVPAYCDVYVLNGEDIEVQKKEKVEHTSISNDKICKNCEFYRNFSGRGQCYGQKGAPHVDDNESCNHFMIRNEEEKDNG